MLTWLREGESGVVVDSEDLLDGGDVGGGSQIEAKVVLHGCLHDVLKTENSISHIA